MSVFGVQTYPGSMDQYFAHCRAENAAERAAAERREQSLSATPASAESNQEPEPATRTTPEELSPQPAQLPEITPRNPHNSLELGEWNT